MIQQIRVAIVDDEAHARYMIRHLISQIPEMQCIGEAADAEEAISLIRQKVPDLVFLDIRLPGKDGFSVVEQIGPANMPAVIFITAYGDHALRAFEFHAIDYLLKPVDEDRFKDAMENAKRIIRDRKEGRLENQLSGLLEQIRLSYVDRIVVKEEERLFFLPTKEIDWIKSEANYVRIYTGKTNHLIRQAIGELETCLNPKTFLRIHRSVIVNLDRVKEVRRLFGGDGMVILQDGTSLRLSRNYRHKLDALMLPRSASKPQ